MFEDLLGRLVSGAIWGAGAGLVTGTLRGGTGMRPVARAFMRAYVMASDKVQEVTAEARESVEDIYAEAKAERVEATTARPAAAGPASGASDQPPDAAGHSSARRPAARSSSTGAAAARSRSVRVARPAPPPAPAAESGDATAAEPATSAPAGVAAE